MDSLRSNIKKGSLIIFNATAIVGICGYVIDIIGFSKTSDILLLNNIAVIVITFAAFLLFHLKILNISVSYTIIVYSALANVLFDLFTDLSSYNKLHFFLRDSIFIILVLTLAALISSKYHALIISAVYLTATIIFNLIIKNVFLQSSIVMLILYVSAYSVVVYFFVDILEKSIIDREKKEKMIYEKNDSLSEVNVLLEERQQRIEEQAEELSTANDQLNSKNEELSELNAMKNKFLSIIGHDLKNPIHIIMGFSEILKMKIDNLSPEKRDKFIHSIFKSAQNTYNLLNNLLDWARSQNGQMVINPENTNLELLINSNIILLKEQTHEKKIKVLTEFPKKPAIAFCDSNMIDTVIRNLLGNAVKFIHPPGEISIKVTIDNKLDQIVTVISDTGTGIPADKMDKLFSIDRQYSSQGTAGEIGTGLGLILCKELIEKNNGKIWVESEINKGSAFTFVLPLTQKE